MATARELFPVFSGLHDNEPSEAEAVKLATVRSITDRPKKRRSRKATRKVAGAQPSYRSESVRLTKREQRELGYFGGEEPLSVQKAILAIAYLLDWYPDSGSDPMPGSAASGMAPLLKKCAADVGKLFFIIDDVVNAGGNPQALPKRRP